jgi:Tfp pilus assembly protein PilX
MKKKINEKGYALVTVLLMITIFMIIVLSVMGQSFNTVKQNQVVEDNSQTVALAEMGVSYFQKMVKNNYLDKKDTVTKTIQDEIDNDQKNDSPKEDNIYLSEASSSMIRIIHDTIQTYITNNPGGKKIVDNNSNASYTVKILEPPEVPVSSNSITLEVTGLVNGEHSGKSLRTTISVTPRMIAHQVIDKNSPFISIDLTADVNRSDIQPCPSLLDKLGNPLGIADLPSILGNLLGLGKKKDSLNLDDFLSPCPNTDVLLNGKVDIGQNDNNKDYSGKTFYLTDELNFLGNGNKLNNVTLHGDNLLSMNGNINSLENVILDTDNLLKVSGNVNNAAGVTLQSMKDATFEKHLDLKGYTPDKSTKVTPSHLYVGSNLTADMGLKLFDGSTAYVGEDANINQGLELYNQSKAMIGVKENTVIDSLKLNSGSFAYIGGDANIGTHGTSSNPAAFIQNLSMEANAVLCVVGILNVDTSVDITNKQIYTPETDINNKCGFNFQTSKVIGFNDSAYNTNVNYNY